MRPETIGGTAWRRSVTRPSPRTVQRIVCGDRDRRRFDPSPSTSSSASVTSPESSKTADALEITALAIATGAQVLALTPQKRSLSTEKISRGSEQTSPWILPSPMSTSTTHASSTRVAKSTKTMVNHGPDGGQVVAEMRRDDGGIAGAWITAPLLVAAWTRALLARRRLGGRGTPAGASMLANVRDLKSGLSKTQETIDRMSKSLDKVQTRSRLMSRDVRNEIKQLQMAVSEHGEALIAAASKLEQLDNNVTDVEGLIGAVQGLTTKQFELLQAVIKRVDRLRELQQQRQQEQRLRTNESRNDAIIDASDEFSDVPSSKKPEDNMEATVVDTHGRERSSSSSRTRIDASEQEGIRTGVTVFSQHGSSSESELGAGSLSSFSNTPVGEETDEWGRKRTVHWSHRTPLQHDASIETEAHDLPKNQEEGHGGTSDSKVTQHGIVDDTQKGKMVPHEPEGEDMDSNGSRRIDACMKLNPDDVIVIGHM